MSRIDELNKANARFLLSKKYVRNNESVKNIYPRVAEALGKDCGLEDDFLRMMRERRWLPASPVLLNAGKNLSNFYQPCVVLPIEDNIESIFDTLQRMAVITKYGGGNGFNFSTLREKDSELSIGGTSSGPLSFMRIYDSAVEQVKQGGVRKGALISTLNYNHFDIYDFIKSKINTPYFQNFNLSVMVNDEFMKSVLNNDTIELVGVKDKNKRLEVNAEQLLYLMSFSAYYSGDPGIQFFDAINKDNPLYPKKVINASNPCSEEFMFSYESCSLTGVNLNEHIEDNDINYDKLKESLELATLFLLCVNKKGWLPYKEMYEARDKYQRIGVGYTGFADALAKMHVFYDSEETLNIINKIGRLLRDVTDKLAPNSISKRAIAPEGSRCILEHCTNSIEPFYLEKYVKHLSIGDIIVKYPKSEYLVLAHNIDPEWRLRINREFQKYIDNGISSTINLNKEATYFDINKIYKKAYKFGLKGVTVFRDESKEGVYRECRSGTCEL